MSPLRLQTRILLGAVATALLAVFLVWASITAAVNRFVDHPDFNVPEPVLEGCRADPSAYAELPFGRGTMRLYAADGSLPGGDPLDAALLDLALGEAEHATTTDGRRIVRRLAMQGDCAFVAFEFGDHTTMDLAFSGGVAFGIFVAMLVAVLLSYRFTVMPLLARIERLRAAGLAVGASGYESADDSVGDDLSAISQVLDRSHERIEADRAELVRRHQGLERYLAEIAHDLRTPLGSMILAMQDVDATAASETSRATARRALSDATYVATLVENLHQAARLRSGLEASVGEVDLTELLQRIEVRFRALGEASGVSVNAALPDGAVIVHCEPSLVERAVSNLVHNSTRHGACNVAILLDVDGAVFTLRVLDDGPGVPPEDLPSLAHRTFSDDPARPRNTGLGLAITNEVVRRLGWQIRYELADAGGLVVTIVGAAE